MFRRFHAVPLSAGGSGRFVPWIVAFMVYLATLSAAGGMVLADLVERWNERFSGTLTVQIPDTTGEDAGKNDAAARLEAALEILRDSPGVATTETLAESEIEALLKPWLGTGFAAKDLPLPQVISVMLEPGATPDLQALEATLTEAAPGATLDDHAVWFDRLATLARSVEFIAGLVVVLTGLTAALIVIFVTRSGLAVHRGVIEVLSLIGAQDSHIARQFQYQAFVLGLRGGVPGLILAVATLMILRLVLETIDVSLLPDLRLDYLKWVALACVPAATAIIVMVTTARITVMRTLARIA